jgi:hypothetical protein
LAELHEGTLSDPFDKVEAMRIPVSPTSDRTDISPPPPQPRGVDHLMSVAENETQFKFARRDYLAIFRYYQAIIINGDITSNKHRITKNQNIIKSR